MILGWSKVTQSGRRKKNKKKQKKRNDWTKWNRKMVGSSFIITSGAFWGTLHCTVVPFYSVKPKDCNSFPQSSDTLATNQPPERVQDQSEFMIRQLLVKELWEQMSVLLHHLPEQFLPTCNTTANPPRQTVRSHLDNAMEGRS